MKSNATIAWMVTAGYTVGGFVCKPDAPTVWWGIGFVALMALTVVIHATETYGADITAKATEGK